MNEPVPSVPRKARTGTALIASSGAFARPPFRRADYPRSRGFQPSVVRRFFAIENRAIPDFRGGFDGRRHVLHPSRISCVLRKTPTFAFFRFFFLWRRVATF
jgi:hypothetical protein